MPLWILNLVVAVVFLILALSFVVLSYQALDVFQSAATRLAAKRFKRR